MNQVFSLKRWGNLMRRHYLENKRSFLFGILCLLAAITITIGFGLWTGHGLNENSLINIYLIGLFLVGAVFASSSFDALQKKERGIAYLTLPASHFEKLLTQIVYNLIFFTIVYTLCFYVMSELFIVSAKHLAAIDPDHYSYRPIEWNEPDSIRDSFWYFLYVFFGVQALFIAGSIYFKRFSFLLTTCLLVVFVFFLMQYFMLLEAHYWRDLNLYFHESALRTLGAGPTKVYPLPKGLGIGLKWILLLGWAPALWLVSWFRLREKEI